MNRYIGRSQNKHFILFLLFVGYLVDYLDRMVMSVAVVSIKEEFNLDAAAVGAILSSFFLSYAIMQIPGGWLTDKLGSRKVLIWSIIVWSVFTVFTGFAWSLISLLVIRFLFGLGQGGYPSASQKGIADYYPRDERPKASAYLMSSNYFGMALAPLVAAPMILFMGWRNMFYVIGLLGILLTVAFWVYFKPKESTASNKTLKENSVPLKELLANSGLWKITVMWFAAGIVNWGLSSWIPSYLMEDRGMDLLSMGFYAALPGLSTGVAMLFSGWLLDRFFNNLEKYYAAFGMLMSGIFLYLMFTSTSIVAAMVYLNLCMIFKSFAFTVAFALPHKIMSKKVIGSAMGVINMGAQAAGFISPLVMGFIISLTGSFNGAFWFLIVCSGISIIAALSIKKNNQIAQSNDVDLLA
ncbi:MFS transporter [Peribacillus butanolivorans]|uniref:MFS transporter n=2 Tax=Peribacillus TaxID=2675229 RepID=A0AAX0S5Z2_9BACI|nr:MFS transporter [Peribacillus butanolivorans]AXN40935.1 MFS transporter [Peribacillus butanolivorans]PEJ36319.1 MFS transporter [Peribacillus butanolivorans]